jgi:hypothetical protein
MTIDVEAKAKERAVLAIKEELGARSWQLVARDSS